jgi:hypothetical protein
MTEDFQFDVMFPDEYRDFIVEISYQGAFICKVTQEAGPTVFSIEFEETSRVVPLVGFMEALEHSRKRLLELQ